MDAGEGIGALEPDFRAMGIERVEGIFLAKCDLIDYDDEIIELEKIDARSCFYENGLPEDCGAFIAGAFSGPWTASATPAWTPWPGSFRA